MFHAVMAPNGSEAALRLPVNRLTDTEPQLDLKRLRSYRLGRLRAELAAGDCAAAILVDPISIRYATGSRNASVFQMHVPMRYLFVPVEGPVVLFDGESYRATAEGLETVAEFRVALPLSHFFAGPREEETIRRWADEMGALVRTHCGAGPRIATDFGQSSAVTALREQNLDLVPAQGFVERARSIKSPDEVLCMNLALAVAEAGAAKMRAALVPGITENELWSLLHQTNIAMGGDWIEGRLLSSGDRLNPWLQEASDRMVRPGELVGFDTDMVGPLGYCADMSRTFHCGPGKPTPAQRDLYKLAFEEIQHNMELLRPGVSFRELSQKAWRIPEPYIKNRYMVLMHGIGMCDEYPAIYHRYDWDSAGYDGTVEENMTLCIESFIGAEGGHEGVKLEEQVLVTRTGVRCLSHFPFEDELLGG